MTSSLFTISPSFFNHLAITASVIDSPSEGTVTSKLLIFKVPKK